jgi:hypothetical protein
MHISQIKSHSYAEVNEMYYYYKENSSIFDAAW